MPSSESNLISAAAMAPLFLGAIALAGCVSIDPSSLSSLSTSTPSIASPSPTSTAWKDLEAGNFDASRAAFESHAGAHPQDPSGHYGLGRVALAQGQRETAISHFDRAIALDDSSAEQWAYLGTAQLQLERNEEAHASLLKALSLDPKQGQAHVAMAEYAAHIELDYDKALQHVEFAKAAGYTAIPAELEPALRNRLN